MLNVNEYDDWVTLTLQKSKKQNKIKWERGGKKKHEDKKKPFIFCLLSREAVNLLICN